MPTLLKFNDWFATEATILITLIAGALVISCFAKAKYGKIVIIVIVASLVLTIINAPMMILNPIQKSLNMLFGG